MMSQVVFDPAHILGCTPDEASRLLEGRRVTPGEVEALAVIYYDWRLHAHDPESYWLTIGQAARILRISPVVVRTLVDTNVLPHVRHESGVPLMRRHEIVERARQPSGQRK
jgi:hypothetical protein